MYKWRQNSYALSRPLRKDLARSEHDQLQLQKQPCFSIQNWRSVSLAAEFMGVFFHTHRVEGGFSSWQFSRV